MIRMSTSFVSRIMVWFVDKKSGFNDGVCCVIATAKLICKNAGVNRFDITILKIAKLERAIRNAN